MDRVNAILASSEYRNALEKIEARELDRIYCHHDIEHLLAVARLMYIDVLESGENIDRELVYAIALLHDIGRSVSDEDHEVQSANIAVHIMEICGYNAREIDMAREAILAHREGSQDTLGALLYRADKMSRNCEYCKAKDSCKWLVKNKGVTR